MKPVPSAPAKTVIRHIQKSKVRVENTAKLLEDFRKGLRLLQEDTIALRNALEDQPEDLEKMERGLMALSYAAGAVIESGNQMVRFEMSFQEEALRWLNGKIPKIEQGRPHLAYQQASPNNGNGGRGERNGTATPPKGAYEFVKAKAEEVPTPQPDPTVAVGFYQQKDPQTGKETRVYVNAYDQVVPPPETDHAVSICGVGETETKLGEPEKPTKPTLIEDNGAQEVIAHQQSQD